MPDRRDATAPVCGKAVYWWDGEYEGECQLAKGHGGDHFDGLSWFNDDGGDTTEDHCHRCGGAFYAGLVHHCPTVIRSFDVTELVDFRPQPDGSLRVEPW